jgi:hypothetical protein
MTMRQAVAFLGAIVSVSVAGSLLGGCTTVNLADAMPTPIVASSPQEVAVQNAPQSVRTDLYPDTVMRPAAAPQITEADRLSATADLRERRDRLAGGSTVGHARSADDLRRIAGSHAEETLRAIEGE